MTNSLKMRTRHALEIAITFTPWLISMYTLYWLQYGKIWTVETLHRDKITIAILATGMVLSFFVHSYFIKRKQK